MPPSQPKTMARNPNATNGKSMHFNVKKREAERIDIENQKLMERIIMSAGTINTKLMKTNYQQKHEAYKRR